VPALEAIADTGADGAALDLPQLTRLLRLGAGVHPRRVLAAERFAFRTYMSAGALYPVELYVATGGVDGLEPGLWHFDPGDAGLERLRDEDCRAALAHAAAAPELEQAGAVLALSGILWRTAWKYGSRGWRHVFWDAGTMLANLLALAASARLRPRLYSAFADDEVARVVGADAPLEQPVALLAVGSGERGTAPPRLGPLRFRSEPLSPRERRFPDAEEAWAASRLLSREEVARWREAAGHAGHPTIAAPSDRADLAADPLEEVILRRGSARAFTADAIGSPELAAILARAAAPVPGDVPSTCSTFVIAHAVEELEPGVHRFQPPDGFELVRSGSFRRQTAGLCLDQPHGGAAAATLYLTADLDGLLGALGDRGYRAAQLDAGIRAGRISLGAYAQGLGATGLTFYDDEVRAFLETEEEPMLCVAVGVDARRPALRRSARMVPGRARG
jgi:SagB-type dehydrogenase family enzyme